jgi:hypothetical protein
MGATLLLALVLVSQLVTGAQGGAPSEYQVKAAYLYNFAKFVTWPPGTFESASDPIRIGILGRDPFGGLLERTVAGKQVEGRSFEVAHLAAGARPVRCQILFFGSDERRTPGEVLDPSRLRGVLTVGESDHFLEEGGGILLFTEEDQVRFQISTDATSGSGLRLNSRLLGVARVRGGTHG